MIKTPNYDEKIKKILDSLQSGERVCTLTGEKWLMDETEIGWYRKFNVPPSKLSPLARMKTLYSYFTVFDIWYNRHAETGKSIVSNIHPSTGIRVLPDCEWFARDFSEINLSVETNLPFFEQLYNISRLVPRAAGVNFVPPKNSIAFLSFGDQDSFFVLASNSTRCTSCTNVYRAEDSTESAMVTSLKKSCNVLHSDRIYNSAFVRESYDCLNCYFIFDCRNCEFCFGSTNQRHKKYLWFGEQLTKNDWEKRFNEIDLFSFETRDRLEKQFHELVATAVWPENFNVGEENSTGEYLNRTIDSRDCYYIATSGCRNLDHVTYGLTDPPSHDVYIGVGIMASANCYYSIGPSNAANINFSLSVNSSCINCEYCESCYNCENCFGCVGLQRKKFCILNKQYSEDEYWKVLDELKCSMLARGEYGEMPPASFSTQVCQTSGLGVAYGASDTECLLFGAKDIKPSDDGAEGAVLDPSLIRSVLEIPDCIRDKEKVAGTVWWDEKMKRRFSYLLPELEIYNHLKIAPPRKHPTRRISDLYREMNMPVFFETECQKCQKKILTAKNQAYPDRKIYCHACYLKYLEENN
jgi:hypothetical protein